MTDKEAENFLSAHRVLNIRSGIITRCRNKNSTSYKDYGRKGIDICDGWFLSPKQFLIDLGLPPDKSWTLDRIDSLGWYSCGKCDQCISNMRRMNCRWATPKQQANNRSSNRFIRCFGVTRSIGEWSIVTGIPNHVIYGRLAKNMPVGKILTERPYSDPVHTHDGLTGTVAQLSLLTGLSRSAVIHRIRRGKPFSKPAQKRIIK